MTDESLPRWVVPGDYLGAAEEFVPGRGTYEDRGRIFAAVMGTARVDAADRIVRVEARNAIPSIEEDDTVYARVEEVKSAMVIVTVVSSASSRRAIPGTPEGTIHISKAKEGYTETLQGEFAPGDIVLARVLQARPALKLTTAAPSLGVLAARCSVCHALMVPGPKELTCPRCGNREQRKLAKGWSLKLPTSDGGAGN
jgi:exosome complex component CSL4